MSEVRTEKIGCIPEATIAGIPVDKTPIEQESSVELPPPGTSVVAFISKLYELVNNHETSTYICWSEEFNKKAIIIPDPVEFSKVILPKFFKHSNICSFVRQLNIYGFRKLETQSGFCFRHESFIADHPELLPNIQRKKPSTQKKKQPQQSQPNEDQSSVYQYLLTQLMQLQKQTVDTQQQINSLKEMLYQMKIREDAMDVKLYRLSEVVMPSLNYGNLVFGSSGMSQTSQQNNSQAPVSPDNQGAFMQIQYPQQQQGQQQGQQPQQQCQTVNQWKKGPTDERQMST
ncbi:HSF type DNA-binding domain containing protein, partial [Entamoeba invadens IP1]